MTDLAHKVKVGDFMIATDLVFMITKIEKDEAKVNVYFTNPNMKNSVHNRSVRLVDGKYAREDWDTLRFATKAEIAKYRLIAGW